MPAYRWRRGCSVPAHSRRLSRPGHGDADMLFVYLLLCAMSAYVVFGDGGEILAEHLLPGLLPTLAPSTPRVSRTTGRVWLGFPGLAFGRGLVLRTLGGCNPRTVTNQ